MNSRRQAHRFLGVLRSVAAASALGLAASVDSYVAVHGVKDIKVKFDTPAAVYFKATRFYTSSELCTIDKCSLHYSN